jgi:hypothetical protein
MLGAIDAIGTEAPHANSAESVAVFPIFVLVACGDVGNMRIDVIFARFLYHPRGRLVVVVTRPDVTADRGLLLIEPTIGTKP